MTRPGLIPDGRHLELQVELNEATEFIKSPEDVGSKVLQLLLKIKLTAKIVS